MKKVITYLNNIFGVRELISHYRKLFAAQKRHRRLIRAVKIALERHKADKRRYYVLYDWEGKYHAFNNTEIAFLKRTGILRKEVTIDSLLKEAALYVDCQNYQTIKEKLKRREL